MNAADGQNGWVKAEFAGLARLGSEQRRDRGRWSAAAGDGGFGADSRR